MRCAALSLIRLYQKISFLLPSSGCRFSPSCSNYAYQAISKYGFIKGTFLSLKRIGRCHPWHEGGIDNLK